jgi:nucleoside-diphosphate-sugar epimerase
MGDLLTGPRLPHTIAIKPCSGGHLNLTPGRNRARQAVYPGLEVAVRSFHPELVMHQLTDLPDRVDLIPEFAGRNNRIRTEGTWNLLAAARNAGAKRFLAQSIAWTPPSGGEAVAEHERLVLDAGGVVVRYGVFYGPGTYSGTDRIPPPPRIHIDEAARQTCSLLEATPGVVLVVEEP